jgi:hypothetical protein
MAPCDLKMRRRVLVTHTGDFVGVSPTLRVGPRELRKAMPVQAAYTRERGGRQNAIAAGALVFQ